MIVETIEHPFNFVPTMSYLLIFDFILLNLRFLEIGDAINVGSMFRYSVFFSKIVGYFSMNLGVMPPMHTQNVNRIEFTRPLLNAVRLHQLSDANANIFNKNVLHSISAANKLQFVWIKSSTNLPNSSATQI